MPAGVPARRAVPDPDLAYVRERGQRRPVFDHERELLPVSPSPARSDAWSPTEVES